MTKNRERAMHIIEEIIEPLLSERGDDKGLEGMEYYKTEDALVELLKEIK